MKNGFIRVIIMLGAAGLMAGCQQASTTTAALFTADAAALKCATLVSKSLLTDDVIRSSASIGSLGIKSSEEIQDGVTGPVLGEDGWWNVTYNYTDASWNAYFKVKDKSGNWVSSSSDLDALTSSDLDALSIYAVLSLTVGSDTMTLNMGTNKSDPLLFEGLVTNPRTLSGSVSLAGTSNGVNYSLVANYDNMAINSSGYPMGGSVLFNLTEGGTQSYGGTVTFDGDNTAIMTFTSASSAVYSINLDTGLIEAL